MSKLPSKSNITIPAGEIFWLPDGALRPYSLGHAKKFGWTPTVSALPIEVSTNGTKTKIGEVEDSVEVAVSLTLQEMRADIMAMAMAGTQNVYTQTAVVNQPFTATGVKKGDVINLGVLDATVSGVEVGGVATEEGAGYTLQGAAGYLIARADGDFTGNVSGPAILASAERAVITILNNTGLEGVFTVIQKNPTGKRYMLRNFRATLKPSSEIPLHTDGSALAEIELSGSGVYNEALPLTPWGELIELA
jgi:hypothetical protein